MKSLVKLLKKRKHIVFLDFEGTQFSHEMIAFGAIRVDLDYKNRIKKIYPGIKNYVLATGSIGKYVQELTGITPEILQKEAISFKEAIIKIKNYCGLSFNNCAFMTFGNHDLVILAKSLEAHPDANMEIIQHIMKNDIDFAAFLSQYVKDSNNNPYSLVNYLKLFGEEPVGISHDPLNDAKDLMRLYKVVLKSNDKVYEEYLKVLKQMRHFPAPVQSTINKLIDGEDVTSEEFKKIVRNYLY